MNLLAVSRYCDAVRHMRMRQLAARPRRLVPTALLAAGRAKPAAWLSAASGAGVDAAPQSGPQPAPHEMQGFRAVGRFRAFPAPRFWRSEDDGMLFLFHLHGFAELARYSAGPRTAAGDEFWSAVIKNWLSECMPPRRPAWHPFPTSGRIIAWCSALSAGGWPAEVERAMLAALEPQLRMLRRSVEHEIGGNHVIRNATALVVGGVCTGRPATVAQGLRLLERELAEQVLADGGHEERSSSYHRVVLADLADVARVLSTTGRPVPECLKATIGRMGDWLGALAGPDGCLPLLNDAWEGPRLEGRSSEALVDLSATGYVVLRHGDDQAVLDVGLVAPPHLPPHAHADVLSFVLWIDGRPLVVDPGAFSYAGPDRARYRGTGAHATVQVDGQDQCDLWGPFRAAHMPRVRRQPTEHREGAVILGAEHDGYRRLADPVVHRRTFCWLPGDGLVVVDRLLARAAHRVQSRIPFGPEADLAPGRAGPLTVEALGAGPEPALRAGTYAPFMGTEVATRTLCREWRWAPGTLSGWALLRPGARAELAGDRLLVHRAGHSPLEVEVR